MPFSCEKMSSLHNIELRGGLFLNHIMDRSKFTGFLRKICLKNVFASFFGLKKVAPFSENNSSSPWNLGVILLKITTDDL